MRTYAAEFYMASNRNRDAIAQYEEVLKLSPQNALALNNLANLYQREKDGRALATAEQALKLAPEHPGIQDTLGWILVEQGHYCRAPSTCLARPPPRCPWMPRSATTMASPWPAPERKPRRRRNWRPPSPAGRNSRNWRTPRHCLKAFNHRPPRLISRSHGDLPDIVHKRLIAGRRGRTWAVSVKEGQDDPCTDLLGNAAGRGPQCRFDTRSPRRRPCECGNWRPLV